MTQRRMHFLVGNNALGNRRNHHSTYVDTNAPVYPLQEEQQQPERRRRRYYDTNRELEEEDLSYSQPVYPSSSVRYVQVPVAVPVPVPVPVIPLVALPPAWAAPYPPVQYPSTSRQENPTKPQASPERKTPKVTLNRILQPYGRREQSAGSLVNISRTPMRYNYTRYDRKGLDELTTEPACSSMTLIHENLPWDINVRAKDSRGVTIRDVLDTVWSKLNKPVSEAEAQETRGHWLVMRHRDLHSNAQESGDRYDGLRRLDWLKLESDARLIGLSPHPKTPGMWYMVFEDS